MDDSNLINSLIEIAVAYVFLIPIKAVFIRYLDSVKKNKEYTMSFIQYQFPRLYSLLKGKQ